MKNPGYFLFAAFFLTACVHAGSEDTADADTPMASTVPVTKKVYDIEPSFQQADRVQVLYYDDPDGDSLRYSRYFTYTETTDTVQMQALLQELDQVYVQEPNVRLCRSEGKLYLLRGEDVLKTIYFSARQDSCRYFYFIKDGSFIYLPLTGAAGKWLEANKQKAKKPDAGKSPG